MTSPRRSNDKLKGLGLKTNREHTDTKSPLWTGPSDSGPNGGITFSMLSRFLCCRERFRIAYIEGLRPKDGFNHRIEFGQMWHVCEEALASESRHFGEVVGTTLWGDNLREYALRLCKQYPLQQEEIDKWYQVIKIQFPVYVSYWAKHPDVKERTPLLQEQTFDVSYRLPSGRDVRLRGKWDAVDLIGRGKGSGIYLQENKTKSEINEQQLKRQLTFDLQTMLYLTALTMYGHYNPLRDAARNVGAGDAVPILGVRYNVIRRPLSGGKGTIVRHKATDGAKCPKCKGDGLGGVEVRSGDRTGVCPKCNGRGRVGGKPEETKESYYDRLRVIIEESPQDFFARWKVEVSPSEVQRFRRECLDPVLEQLCEWWEWVVGDRQHGRNPFSDLNQLHWRHPFGVFNILDEGGVSELDEYLHSGSEVGLERVDCLFTELT